MSGDAKVTGRININPPITWGEAHDKPWARGADGYPDAHVHFDTATRNTPTEVVTVYSGVAIAPFEGEQSARTLLADVDRIVKEFATAPDGTGREFAGYLHVVWGGGEAIYRVHVVDGQAVEAKPQMVWPDGARDEDSVAPEPRW